MASRRMVVPPIISDSNFTNLNFSYARLTRALSRQVIARRHARDTLGALITMWTCPKCKTAISSDFDSCWNCGTEASGRINQEFVHADQYRPIQTTKPSQFSILWLMIITASICYGIALTNYVFVIAGLTFLVLSFACNALGR